MKENNNFTSVELDHDRNNRIGRILRYFILGGLTVMSLFFTIAGTSIPALTHIQTQWFCILTLTVLISTQD